jgi:hypothetical protein
MLPMAGRKWSSEKDSFISRSRKKRAVSEISKPTRTAVARDLAAHLGADRASGSGNEDNFAFDSGADFVVFELDGGAAEDIFYGDVADLPGEAAVGEDLGQGGHSFKDYAGGLALRGDFAHLGGASRRDRDQDLSDSVMANEALEVTSGAEDTYALNEQSFMFGVVNEAARGSLAARSALRKN